MSTIRDRVRSGGHIDRILPDGLGIDVEDLDVHVMLWVIIIAMMTPIGFAALFSTQTTLQTHIVMDLAPGGETLQNYTEVLFDHDFAVFMRNSLIMTVIIILGKLSFSLLAATAIVYYDFKYSQLVFYTILFTLMMPIPVRIVPLYQLMVDLGWTNSFAGLTAPYIASATSVFLFRQRFRSIPPSILETAKLDGIGPIRFLVFVLIPMSKGMIVGVTTIMFISMWNKYLWPLVVVTDRGSQVVQVGLSHIQGTASEGLVEWNLVMAGAMLALIPPLIVMILFHRHLLSTFGVEQR